MRGADIDRKGVVWVSRAAAIWGRSTAAIKGPLNGPQATGNHCPEGWTFHKYPGPGFAGIGDNSAESSYYSWVDQHNTFGLGNDVPMSTGNLNDGIIAYANGQMVTLRVPYPLGFYSRALRAHRRRQWRLEGPRPVGCEWRSHALLIEGGKGRSRSRRISSSAPILWRSNKRGYGFRMRTAATPSLFFRNATARRSLARGRAKFDQQFARLFGCSCWTHARRLPQVKARHIGQGAAAHGLNRAGRLIGAPIAFAAHEHRGTSMVALKTSEARRGFWDRSRAARVALERAGELGARIFRHVDADLRLGPPSIGRDLRRRRHEGSHRLGHPFVLLHHIIGRDLRHLLGGSRFQRMGHVPFPIRAFVVVIGAEEGVQPLGRMEHVVIGARRALMVLIIFARRVELGDFGVQFVVGRAGRGWARHWRC